MRFPGRMFVAVALTLAAILGAALAAALGSASRSPYFTSGARA